MAAAPFYHHVIVHPHDNGSYGVFLGCYADMMAKNGEGNARVIKISIADSPDAATNGIVERVRTIIAESSANPNTALTVGRMIDYLKRRLSESQSPYAVKRTTMQEASYGTTGVLEGVLQL